MQAGRRNLRKAGALRRRKGLGDCPQLFEASGAGPAMGQMMLHFEALRVGEFSVVVCLDRNVA
jgi:hypothetical protein